MKLKRNPSQWLNCDPQAMSQMSQSAIVFALQDAKEDILTMAKLLCEAGYPRRGTDEENQTIMNFAEKVQSLIPHKEAVELS